MLEHNEKIIDADIKDEMKTSYIDYAMSVITARALPDVRDGLKPVHRRILYTMHELGNFNDKPHKKSVRIVGDVLGKYHPHGDSSVYNAMVRMAQDFAMRNPLVDGHGNFGSIDGDGAAAMRYTESRMTKLAAEMLKDIKKDTVDVTPNFDETLKEPTVLPSRFPNLLVNGTNGIAVGMATSIPPHNLNEVIDATVKLIDDNEATLEDLMEIVQGPDFPTGAMIMGMESFRKGYRTGRGKAVVRSKADIVDIGKGKSAIIITEIPYQVNKARMVESIADLVRSKKVEGITDLRDESNRKGIRIVIELRKDVNANVLLNKLYKHTALQTTVSLNMIALVGGQPKVLNLYEILRYYLDHQIDVETRRVQYDLKKAEDRAHILEGLLKALDHIDEIVEIIKASANRQEAAVKLIERFAFSEIQANAILEMRLHRLTGLEREKIQSEYDELQALITELRAILADQSLLLAIIKEDLLRIKEKYGDERRTEITFSMDDIDIEDMIEEEDVTITLTHQGYIKRVTSDTYQTQKRGGVGKTGLSTKEEDFVEHIFNTSTHDYLLFFTNLGRVYRKKAYFVPEASRTAKGTAIVNMLQLMPGELVNAVIPVKEFGEGFLMLATKNGVIKKSALLDFDTSRKTGLIAINLNEGDELISVKITTGDDDVIVFSSNGKAIRFSEKDVRKMGRSATGVRSILLGDGDHVVSMELITQEMIDKSARVLAISEKGYGKRTPLVEYRQQTRGGKGVKTYNITEKTGRVVSARIVTEDEDIMLINSNGVIIRIKVEGISTSGRSTSGVTLMRTKGDDKIIAVAKILSDSEEEEEISQENE
ncbi:DNA gyrase subunit A [Acidaminobacter sp. JC074]|uniref:DNA gyrase subunit A n=1 Tax=Acidaminobacter sp. JC074 TaxID=2530199 RepID=UPI001F10D2BD|nr:DNA gyrase subunit A [Acidaminobacter sp. JC074]MCH4891222.1 DNA gyrase subunit A [Acidaminobacter sp. JC074]